MEPRISYKGPEIKKATIKFEKIAVETTDFI